MLTGQLELLDAATRQDMENQTLRDMAGLPPTSDIVRRRRQSAPAGAATEMSREGFPLVVGGGDVAPLLS